MPQVIYADNFTEAYGTENCRRIRQHIFTELSPIAGDLTSHYVKTAERSSFEQANHALIKKNCSMPPSTSLKSAIGTESNRKFVRSLSSLSTNRRSLQTDHIKPTASMIREWQNNLPCSSKRKSNISTPLRRLFDEMFLDGVIDKNPLARVKNLPTNTREPEPFTQEEIAKIINELTGQEKNLIQFAFWSGLRTSEINLLRALCTYPRGKTAGYYGAENQKRRATLTSKTQTIMFPVARPRGITS